MRMSRDETMTKADNHVTPTLWKAYQDGIYIGEFDSFISITGVDHSKPFVVVSYNEDGDMLGGSCIYPDAKPRKLFGKI